MKHADAPGRASNHSNHFRPAFLIVRGLGSTLLFMLALSLLTGCAGSRTVSDESGFTISSLEDALQAEGVFVMPRGEASFAVPAEQSARLILDSSEVLNVFEFRSAASAREQAHAFAGSYPGNDVYLRERLVVIRQSRGDTGLSGTLRKILGEAL